MHKLILIDLEARVLDRPERVEVAKIIEREANRRLGAMRSLRFKTPKKVMDGAELFVYVQAIESSIDTAVEQRLYGPQTFSLIVDYIGRVDQLYRLDSAYYEFPFVNGRNLLSALAILEDEVIHSRDNLPQDDQLREKKMQIFSFYDQTETYFADALRLFNQFAGAQTDGDQELLRTWRAKILSYSAMMQRRKAFFTLISTSSPDRVLMNIDPILDPTKKSVELYSQIFRDETFFDDSEAAGTLANLANALKPLADVTNGKGLQYYYRAREIVGHLPSITEGIEVYQTLLAGGQSDSGGLNLLQSLLLQSSQN